MVTNLFPMFVKLEGRRCLVVGAGAVGEPKIRSLLDTGTEIHVVALEASDFVHQLASEGRVHLSLREFVSADLEGCFLAVVATSSQELNSLIFREAQARGILCNVVDDPPNCDFYYPALVRRGALQIAISTSGRSPSLAQKIRQQLERQFGAAYEQWVEELGKTRQLVLASNLDAKRKRELLTSLASRTAFEAIMAQVPKRAGQPEHRDPKEPEKLQKEEYA